MFCFCFKGLLSVRVENRWRRQQREAGRRPADRTGGGQSETQEAILARGGAVSGGNSARPSGEGS